MSEIRPFNVCVSNQALTGLRTKLKDTRWINDVFEADWSLGAPVPFVQSLCNHWLNVFDWRALEARINRERNITTEIGELTIHAATRESTRKDAVPLIILHGWPSSFLEFLDLFEPFAHPPANEQAFHVVAPSIPGYGFSTTKPGVTPQRIAAMFVTLMERLGYRRFMIQGGNWGSLIGTEIARQFPDRVIGLHLNLLNGSRPADADSIPLNAQEQAWVAEHSHWLTYPHFQLLSQKPASATHAFNDSPAGLAAWISDKIVEWSDNTGSSQPVISLDRLVGNIALYWFTETIASSARLYYDMVRDPPKERFVTVPTAAAIFPKEVVKLPRAWAERHYNIKQWNVFERGGHFPAMEAPAVLVEDVRRFAKMLHSR